MLVGKQNLSGSEVTTSVSESGIKARNASSMILGSSDSLKFSIWKAFSLATAQKEHPGACFDRQAFHERVI